jgi:hypothetical protein
MRLALVLVLAACGGAPATGGVANSAPEPVVRDTRSPIEKRRDAACEAIGPKLTECAVDDARAKLAAGRITQQQFDGDTKPEIQRGLTAEWLKKCKVEMSSRQVRVLEVCHREETACAPLQDCLQNLQPQTK